MYGYEYEVDILLVLRLAKFLHRQNPDALKEVLEDFPVVDLYLLFELSERIIWEICSHVVFDLEEELETSFCTFSHPLIARFCKLSMAWSCVRGCSVGAWQRKLSDIAEYFLTGTNHSVVQLVCYARGDFAEIRTWFSPDCYESEDFGNSLVDMLLFLQRENERLEGLLKEAEMEEELEAA